MAFGARDTSEQGAKGSETYGHPEIWVSSQFSKICIVGMLSDSPVDQSSALDFLPVSDACQCLMLQATIKGPLRDTRVSPPMHCLEINLSSGQAIFCPDSSSTWQHNIVLHVRM